jgi:AmmeMemoRadiSam system protein B
MASPVRHAAVAGRFYPGDAEGLREEASSYLSQSGGAEPVKAFGCIVPHAGYMYSGHVAGAVFARLRIPPRCIVLCPNHTGVGHAVSVMSEGVWETPLGKVPIDSGLAVGLKHRFPGLEEDASAHRAEHAAEVELPFLQIMQPALNFVPIALAVSDFKVLEQLGNAIADEIAPGNDEILIVASSDMNHYEPDDVTRAKDHRAIERILTLDARGLHDVVTQQKISMCGVGPAVVMLTAAKRLGAKSAELVKYSTSGDISGDHALVVGYAGVIVS